MLNGWYQRNLGHEGIILSEYKENQLLTSICFKANGTYTGHHRPDAHTPWKSYKEYKEMDAIWDAHYTTALDFEKHVHNKF